MNGSFGVVGSVMLGLGVDQQTRPPSRSGGVRRRLDNNGVLSSAGGECFDRFHLAGIKKLISFSLFLHLLP